MISSFETQRPVWTVCLLLLGATCCCCGLPQQQTDNMADQMQSASKMIRQQQTAVVDLGALLDAGDGAIVTLVAGETRLAVHREVLVAGSPLLTAMLRPGTPEAGNGDVAVLDVEGPVLRQLVAFLYTGRAPQIPGMALPLLAAAEKYSMASLRDVCEQLVADQLSVENAVATAVLAVRHNYLNLRKAAVCFIRKHLEVMATKGWVFAVHNNPGEVVEFTGQLADTCEAATTDSRPAATTTAPIAVATTTATAAAPPAAATAATTTTAAPTAATTAATTSAPTTATMPPTAPTPDPAAVSHYRSLSADEKGKRLREAAKKGAVEEVRALLAAGAPMEDKDGDGYTALHWAMSYDKAVELRLLVAAGADLNAKDKYGWTPLHWAAYYDNPEEAAILLEAGADRGARDNEGQTPLVVARRYNRPRVLQLLQ